ncbi:MAG: transcription antitermination protein NusB [Solirubrobacteraceae bacterium]|jgi:N utilization substance protein B|nr:transcription antitermination protein NusB [Solirubrobacteraceae bacterium]MEA2356654.1 transcription antitermination protein NusB [Solirubrobacteraceae bacterium]
MRRSEQRRAAVIALYQHDLTRQSLAETLGPDARELTRSLAHAAADRAEELDAVIESHARGWTAARIAPLERNIMRIALIEMLHPDAVPADDPIPPEGAIDEAVESAKVFCSAEAPGFVNGILDAILRDLRRDPAPDGSGPPPPDPGAAAPPAQPAGAPRA